MVARLLIREIQILLRHLSTTSAGRISTVLEMIGATLALSRCRLVRPRRLRQDLLLHPGLVLAQERDPLHRRTSHLFHLHRRHVLPPGRGREPWFHLIKGPRWLPQQGAVS